MDAEKDTARNVSEATGEPTYRQIQVAHQKYFEDLAAGWNASVLQFHKIQTDLGRTLEQAWLKRDANAWQSAISDYQRAFQSAAAQVNLLQRYNEALRSYKQTMLAVIGRANPDDLNFTDLACIGQSFSTVWRIAWMLAQQQMPATGTGATVGGQ